MSHSNLSEIGQEAVRYAQLGWYVFPLHTPRPDGTCSCMRPSCQNQGKHPRTQHGLNDATTDTSRVAAWWGMWPDANIGVACGASGIVAVDVDPRHGGDESLRDLEHRYGKDAFQTVSAATGGGGEHYIYAAPVDIAIGNVTSSSKCSGPLGPGIDVRANGGYIVAPPSLHRSGDYYEWYTAESPFEREAQALPLPLVEAMETPERRSGDASPVSAAEILTGVPQGERDWRLFQLAAKLRHVEVPIDWAFKLVGGAAANCAPPFPPDEARAKVISAYKRYEGRSGAFVAEEEATAAGGLTGRELLGRCMAEGGPETLWLVEDLVIRGLIHTLYGEPESGKTIIALSWALQVAQRGEAVLYLDEESGIPTVARLLRDMGAVPALVDRYIHYFPFPDIAADRYTAVRAYADEVQPALIIFDALTDMLASAGLDENKGIEVTSWMNQLALSLARSAYLPSVVLVDHVSKDTENIRYAVASRAKKAKSDVLWYARKNADFDREHIAFVDLERHKNRPGILPKRVRYTVGGKDGMLICRRFDASQDEFEAEHPKAQEFLAVLAEGVPIGRAGMVRRLGLSKDTVDKISSQLVRAGRVISEGSGRQQHYRATVGPTVVTVDPDHPELSRELSDSAPLIGGRPTALQAGGSPMKKRLWWQDEEEDQGPWQ